MIAAWMSYAIVVSVPIALAAVGVSAFLRKHGIAERFVWLSGDEPILCSHREAARAARRSKLQHVAKRGRSVGLDLARTHGLPFGAHRPCNRSRVGGPLSLDT